VASPGCFWQPCTVVHSGQPQNFQLNCVYIKVKIINSLLVERCRLLDNRIKESAHPGENFYFSEKFLMIEVLCHTKTARGYKNTRLSAVTLPSLLRSGQFFSVSILLMAPSILAKRIVNKVLK
jgi:hypothetical protein